MCYVCERERTDSRDNQTQKEELGPVDDVRMPLMKPKFC
jgi:hypothetical protein